MKKPLIVVLKKGEGMKVFVNGESFEIKKEDILN